MDTNQSQKTVMLPPTISDDEPPPNDNETAEPSPQDPQAAFDQALGKPDCKEAFCAAVGLGLKLHNATDKSETKQLCSALGELKEDLQRCFGDRWLRFTFPVGISGLALEEESKDD